MASDFFTSVVEQELQMAGNPSNQKTPYTYQIILGSSREDQTGTAINFAFKKEIEITEQEVDSITGSVLSILDTDDIGIIDSILTGMKLSEVSLVKNRKKNGQGSFSLGYASDASFGNNVGIQKADGKFESPTRLRSLLKLLTIRYVIEEMTSPTTKGLRHRTGRFASSVDLFPIKVNPNNPGTLSLYYTYMLYPYATFDPLVSSRPAMYRNGERNPQILIGEALLKAARSIIHARYKLDVKQGR